MNACKCISLATLRRGVRELTIIRCLECKLRRIGEGLAKLCR